MRSAPLFAALAAAAVVLAAPPAAHAQPTLERVAAGPLLVGGEFPDAGFQHAYSFRATGFAPGSAGDAAVVGGSGVCRAGDPCQSSVARDFVPGLSTYFLGITFGGAFYGSPSLYVNTSNTGTSGSELFLTGYVPPSPINAFYVVLTAPPGGEMELANGFFVGAPPVDAPGFATTGGGSWYGLFRYEDLRNEFLFFDLNIAGNTAGTPSVEVYVGALPVQAVPEPTTVALTAAGLGVLLVTGRRRRSR